MFEQLLESTLIRLQANNFVDSKQIVDQLSAVLLDETLDDSQIALCNSKIFSSDLSLFLFLERHAGLKDNLTAQVRKGIFKMLASYVKLRKLKIFEYIELIYNNCLLMFKKDESNQAKETALSPIGKIIKHIEARETLIKTLRPSISVKILLDEVKFNKPTQKVKGSVWNLLGLLCCYFKSDMSDDLKIEVQQVCLKELQEQMRSSKPEVSYIAGMLKSFRYTLTEIHITQREIAELFRMTKLAILPIKDVKQYAVIINGLKLMCTHALIFKQMILEDAQSLLDELLVLISHDNRDVKFTASDCLESVMSLLATQLDNMYDHHQKTFTYIIEKMFNLVKLQQQAGFTASITVIIRSIGIFSKAIAKHIGQDQLKVFFKQMINLSETRLIKYIEKEQINAASEFTPAEEENFKKGTSFKTILYRQKQVISFISSFGNIIKELTADTLSEEESSHLLRLSIIGFSQYASFYEKYKQGLIDSLVCLIREMKKHTSNYILFLDNLVTSGILQSIKLPNNNYLSITEYYDTLKQCCSMWQGLFKCKCWTDDTLLDFAAKFFGYVLNVMENSDLGYSVIYRNSNAEKDDEMSNIIEINDEEIIEEEEDTAAKIHELIGDVQQVQYVANNEQELQFFYRLTLLFDGVLGVVRPSLFVNYVYVFYKSIILSLRKLPRSIVLLKLLKCLNSYLDNNSVLRQLKQYARKDMTQQIKIFFNELYKNLGKYQDELLVDSLKAILSVPFEVIAADNFAFFKSSIVTSLKKGFELGIQNLSLGFASMDCLSKIVKKSRNRSVDKQLKLVIPYLSGYLSVSRNDLEQMISQYQLFSKKKNEDAQGAAASDPSNQMNGMFNLTLGELEQRRGVLVSGVLQLLGQLGGEAHLIVNTTSSSAAGGGGGAFPKDPSGNATGLDHLQLSTQDNTIISWDYEAQLIFALPLLAKKIDLNMTKLLPRVVQLATSHPDDKVKVYACETIHALTVYMIGQQATSISGGQKKRGKEMDLFIKSKESYSKIYAKLFPTIFSIGSNQAHPSYQLINQLILQMSRWFANSKQLESPEVAELLDSIMNFISSKDNNNLRELAATCLGQFIKWTLKQNSQQEIKINHSNIKSTLRRIQSYAGQPDPSKRFGALLALKELVNHTKNEIFLVDKFIMETVYTCTRIAQKSAQSAEVEDNLGILVKIQAEIIQKREGTLRNENPLRSGPFKKLDQLLNYLFETGFFDKSLLVRKTSFELWQAILKGKGSAITCRQFLEQKGDKINLFPKAPALKFKIDPANQAEFFSSVEQLLIQIDVWQQVVRNNHVSTDELFKFKDFGLVFCYNIEKFLQSLSLVQLNYQKQDGHLMELLMEDAVDMSFLDTQMQCIVNAFEALTDFLDLFSSHELEFETFLKFLTDLSFDQFVSIFLQMMLKPNNLLRGMNVDIFLTKSESYFTKLSKVFTSLVAICPKNIDFFETYILQVLTTLFRDYKPRVPFEDLLTDESQLKENELKVFLTGMKILFKICMASSERTRNFMEKAIGGILDTVKNTEESLLAKPDPLFRESRTQLLFQFALDIGTQSTNKIILQTVSSQSQFFQKYENPLMKYVRSKWDVLGKDFMNVAKTNISLLRLSIPLAQSLGLSSVKILSEVLPSWNGEGRNNEGTLQLELRLNWLVLSFFQQKNQSKANNNKPPNSQQQIILQNNILLPESVYAVYLEQLIIESLMNTQNSLQILEQALGLLGLYSSTANRGSLSTKREIKNALTTLRTKYFPVRVRELKINSRDEVDFRTVLGSLLDMTILAGQIELIEFFFPVLRENLPEQYAAKMKSFLKRFIEENYIGASSEEQVKSMRWAFSQFTDKELDRSLVECARYEVVQQILVPLIERGKEEAVIEFMVSIAKQIQAILESTEFLKESSVKEIVRWIQELTVVFKILESLYKSISGEKIKEVVHKQVYGQNSSGNELTKLVVSTSFNYRKQEFERANDIFESQKKSAELIGIDCSGILRSMHSAAYNCLSRVIMATQSKENVWNQFLFLVKNDKLWELLVNSAQQEFEFEIHTAFQDQAYARTKQSLQAIPQIQTKQLLAKKFLTDTLLCTFNKPSSASQAFLPNNPGRQEGEDKDRLDDFYEDDEDEKRNLMLNQQIPQVPGNPLQDNTKTLEMDSINQHPCMGTIMEIIDRMVEKFPCAEGVMPQWMGYLLEEVKKETCSLAVRIFIIKIVINKQQIFEKYAAQWLDVLIDYAKLKKNGAKFFHYFLRDVCTVMIEWCSKHPQIIAKRNLTAEKKQSLSNVVNKICRVLAHKEREIFRQNASILKTLCEFWKDCIFVEEGQITQMLMQHDGENKEEVELWNLNAVVIIDMCIHHRIPIFMKYEDLAKAQTLEEKYAFFINLHAKDRLKKLIFLLNHAKKHFCKAAASVCGGLLQYLRECGGKFEDMRRLYEQEVIKGCSSLLQQTDKTSKERFPLVIACITQHYPDFLANTPIMVQAQDYVGQKAKADRAYILAAMYAFLHKKFDKRENIKDEVHKVCTCFRGNIANIASDDNPENQEKFLSLMVFLSDPLILGPFADSITLMKLALPALKAKYERHYVEHYATAYFTIVFNLYDFMINQEDSNKESSILDHQDPEIVAFKSLIKTCILTGLTSQHLLIREKTFGFLDRETNDSKTPYERLLFLIQEIYQPEQERLWLLSAVPLILCLSKRTSDYSKHLFDEPLSKLAHFYDWDFRDSVNMRIYNASQPLTPLFTLSQAPSSTYDAQGFAIPAPRKNNNKLHLYTQIPQQEGVRATQASQDDNIMTMTQSDKKKQFYQQQLGAIRQQQQQQSSQSQSFVASQSRNPFMFSFSQNLQPIQEDPLEYGDQSKESNQSSQQMDIFGSEQVREKKNQDLSKFFSSHNFSFSQVNVTNQSMLRFQEKNDGKIITKQAEIRKRQEEQFLYNQQRLRKQQLQTIRKYKIGELPDIGIQHKDIIDPLIALSFVDESISGSLFELLVYGLFKDEESMDRQKKLKEILTNLLSKSITYDFNFVSSIHKTMLVLCKEGELFDSALIRQSALHSHSYYTAIVLLEESLFTLFNRKDEGQENKAQLMKNRAQKIRKNLSNQQKKLLREEEEEGSDEEAIIEEQKGIQARKQQLDENIKKRDEICLWMDLIDVYSQVGEKDAIKGILKQAVSSVDSQLVLKALDLKFAGQIQHSEEILNSLVGQASKEANEQKQLKQLDGRVHKYIQSEYHDTLALLGKWDLLANELIDINKDQINAPESLGVDTMKMLMLSLMQSDTTERGRWDDLMNYVKVWGNTPWGKSALEGPLSYEMSLITIIEGDIDKTRYYHKQSMDQFLKVWTHFGSFASASKHEHLSAIQKNYELKEYLAIDGKIEVSLDDFTSLFRNWQNRQPSEAFDSQICWDQLLNSREIYSLALFSKYSLEKETINKIRSSWYVQNVKGMLKKGIYGAADRKMKKASKFRRVEDGLSDFSWEYYKITAKLKLKQLEIDLRNDSNTKNPQDKFDKLVQVFEKEKNKYSMQLSQLQIAKFDFLNIQVHEKFIDVYNDYAITQQVDQNFLDNYAFVINKIYSDYFSLFGKDVMRRKLDNAVPNQATFENTFTFRNTASLDVSAAAALAQNPKDMPAEEVLGFRRKTYQRFANFCEQLLRIIESESREQLKIALKKEYQLSLESVGVCFLEYTLKCFALSGISGSKNNLDSNKMQVESASNNQDTAEIINSNQGASELDPRTSNLVLKMLRIIQKLPTQTASIFQNAIEESIIPAWVFIAYIPQMLHVLKKQQLSEVFGSLLEKLAKNYPAALIYQFNTLFPHRHVCETRLALKIYDDLHKQLPSYFTFIGQLNSLTHPEHRIIYHLENLKNTFIHYQKLAKSNLPSNLKNAKEDMEKGINTVISELESDIFAGNPEHVGSYNAKFARDHMPSFKKLRRAFTGISEASDSVKKEAYDLIKTSRDKVNVKELKSGTDKLANFSVFLADFQGELDIEIPGQYAHSSAVTEPFKESHIRIQSFDTQILTLQSIRRPKRLCVYGSDEKTYKFLVKGIEDLRLDQRIEQLYSVMNGIMANDPACAQKELSIATFKIVPMTNILGLLEWVDKTSVLKEILNREFQEKNGKDSDVSTNNEGIRQRKEWLQSINRKASLADQHILLQLLPAAVISENFESQANLIPADLMRNALERLASTCETYLYLKERFIRNYAVLCVAGYILGIGDRHLENFLVNYSTGDIVSIDFGYSFGAGLGLAVPELMPFRLTRCFTHLMSPIGTNGIFRHSMISAMSSLKKKRNILLEFCEVFINDPLVDWVKLTKDKKMGTFLFSEGMEHLDSAKSYQLEQSLKDQQTGNTIDASLMDDIIIHLKRIDIVKLKLIGMNPSLITTQELSSTKHKTEKYFNNLVDAVKGNNKSVRANYQDVQFLEVTQQVDCLIDLATDPNIIGRVWIGWSPIV